MHLRGEVWQLRRALQGAFERLEPSGRCAVVTQYKWEAEAVDLFFREHEAPSAAAAAALAPDRLAELYPLEATAKDYAVLRLVRRAARGQGHATLHVLEKALRQAGRSGSAPRPARPIQDRLSEPPPPPFGAWSAGPEPSLGSTAPPAGAVLSPAEEAEMKALEERIVELKARLRAEGLSLSQVKKDARLAEWVRQATKLRSKHSGADTVETRCSNRSHISVLHAEAVDEVVALGPDRCYVDCTFGRGGHSTLLLSRLARSYVVICGTHLDNSKIAPRRVCRHLLKPCESSQCSFRMCLDCEVLKGMFPRRTR